MKTLEIHGGTGVSNLLIGEKLENLKKYIPTENVVIISDTNVCHLYQKDFPACKVITIGTGEKIKTLDTVRTIYGKLVALEADRTTFIVGIGGGIVCDIAGFVASTYLRGVRFGFVSSTLLSQVDASVGGKNGVNFEGYKNMVGVFNQPEFVICDTDLLKTLSEKDVLCGFAEIIKHAVIMDADLFAYLENHYEEVLALDTEVIGKLVYDSVFIKSSIVSRDEKEAGERRKLNFGHTFGHAIEKTTAVPHGEAVSAGMIIASNLSVRKGYLSKEDAVRIKALIKKLKLPTSLPSDSKALLEALRKDKKREKDSIHFVMLKDIGNAFVDQIPIEQLEAAIDDFF